ncbi:hypothetical protein AAFF_G00201770 [Aldrovandia affinis]|uniref:Uncharacterized protein n=1 Tax=Aldrovandia affinis TaxID=143900 RepID=A0AAD7SYS6_9TELE|nr:hypothetical protein AAFF_G00201770 [Aldrovandia affinis]
MCPDLHAAVSASEACRGAARDTCSEISMRARPVYSKAPQPTAGTKRRQRCYIVMSCLKETLSRKDEAVNVSEWAAPSPVLPSSVQSSGCYTSADALSCPVRRSALAAVGSLSASTHLTAQRSVSHRQESARVLRVALKEAALPLWLPNSIQPSLTLRGTSTKRRSVSGPPD